MAVAKFLFAEKKQSKIFNPVQKLDPLKILVKARFYPSYEKVGGEGAGSDRGSIWPQWPSYNEWTNVTPCLAK